MNREIVGDRLSYALESIHNFITPGHVPLTTMDHFYASLARSSYSDRQHYCI